LWNAFARRKKWEHPLLNSCTFLIDTNKDGTVSSQEKAHYSLMHPEVATDSTSQNYISQGSLSEYQGGISAILNISA